MPGPNNRLPPALAITCFTLISTVTHSLTHPLRLSLPAFSPFHVPSPCCHLCWHDDPGWTMTERGRPPPASPAAAGAPAATAPAGTGGSSSFTRAAASSHWASGHLAALGVKPGPHGTSLVSTGIAHLDNIHPFVRSFVRQQLALGLSSKSCWWEEFFHPLLHPCLLAVRPSVQEMHLFFP